MINYGTQTSQLLGDSFKLLKHASGLNIFFCPKEGYLSSFAAFATNYGSIDCCFKREGEAEYRTVPDGIAHFLEHKLFENEQCDAFERFAKTGAYSNAFTSFDKTCYYITCTENFYDSLEILLDFVSSPYFTAQTVEKEQGIIGQEIKMYDDQPGWRVFFNLLDSLYHDHPVKRDIAGTVETISQITDELLYHCYHTFYNLSNMVLVVAGHFDEQKVLALCDKIIKPAPEITLERSFPVEPDSIVKDYAEQALAVSVPLFCLGYKEKPAPTKLAAADEVIVQALLELIAGKGSDLYRSLYDEGLINSDFSYEYMTGRGFCSVLFSGESAEPKKVAQRIDSEIQRFKKDGITDEDFIRVRAKVCGMLIKLQNTPEHVGLAAMTAFFCGYSPFATAEAASALTKQQLLNRLSAGFSNDQKALSVIVAAE